MEGHIEAIVNLLKWILISQILNIGVNIIRFLYLDVEIENKLK